MNHERREVVREAVQIGLVVVAGDDLNSQLALEVVDVAPVNCQFAMADDEAVEAEARDHHRLPVEPDWRDCVTKQTVQTPEGLVDSDCYGHYFPTPRLVEVHCHSNPH